MFLTLSLQYITVFTTTDLNCFSSTLSQLLASMSDSSTAVECLLHQGCAHPNHEHRISLPHTFQLTVTRWYQMCPLYIGAHTNYSSTNTACTIPCIYQSIRVYSIQSKYCFDDVWRLLSFLAVACHSPWGIKCYSLRQCDFKYSYDKAFRNCSSFQWESYLFSI